LTKFRKYSSSILFWSLISAAFIGPGTVITALSSGKDFQGSLIWTLIFATAACMILQEAVARLTLKSGKNLGQILREKYAKNKFIPVSSVIVIVTGCIAYQAGNLTGASIPVVTQTGIDAMFIIPVIGLLAFIVLSLNRVSLIAKGLGIVVAAMGAGFISLAFNSRMEATDMVNGLIPTVPGGASLIVLGLIGTTIVPYNLFLGSGIARDPSLKTMRVGIISAVGIGGIISIAILITGAALPPSSAIRNAGILLSNEYGKMAGALFTIGLFSAGFTSSVTAPLAAAITLRSITGKDRYYKSTWIIVLISGIFFSLVGGSPVPLIILAQAINGAFLPFVVLLIILIVNDQKYMAAENGRVNNILLLIVFLITSVIGLLNILKAAFRTVDQPVPENSWIVLLVISSLATIWLAGRVFIRRSPH
jgi:Mn2+/Fe2+ NRAMP family transporter